MPFREIVGHGPLLDLLRSAAFRGTLPPSLILAGPDGVGKRVTALALAQALNCVKPSENDACGVCPACARIARGVHADVLGIEPGDSGSIKVDQVRDAVEHSGYRPFEGKRRVVIFEPVDAMVPEAQNALLKTLEEPSASSIFILITSRPDLLLPTVRSRCQHLRFGRLAPADVAAILMRQYGYGSDDAHAAAAASEGSVGAALEGASEEFGEARDAARRILEIVASARDPRRRLDGARTLIGPRGTSDRQDLARRLRSVASMLRDLGLLRSRADERALANADLKGPLNALLPAFDGDRTLRAFAAVDRALDALERNASPKIVADWIVFNL